MLISIINKFNYIEVDMIENTPYNNSVFGLKIGSGESWQKNGVFEIDIIYVGF